MDVKKEIANATAGGRNIHVLTPDTGNVMYKKSSII
jgi:hypothetical protein